MASLAHVIDWLLYALVALSAALVSYKAIQLTLPPLYRPTSLTSEDQLDAHMEHLEQFMATLAAIATTAPFVGLAGTVIHIMQALKELTSASVNITLISGPITTALNATLIGLCAAIPAYAAYNLLTRRLQLIEGRLRRSLP